MLARAGGRRRDPAAWWGCGGGACTRRWEKRAPNLRHQLSSPSLSGDMIITREPGLLCLRSGQRRPREGRDQPWPTARPRRSFTAQEKPGAGGSPAGLLTGRGPAIPRVGGMRGRADATSREEAQLATAAAHPTIALSTARSCKRRGVSPNHRLFQTQLFREPPNEHTLTPATLPRAPFACGVRDLRALVTEAGSTTGALVCPVPRAGNVGRAQHTAVTGPFLTPSSTTMVDLLLFVGTPPPQGIRPLWQGRVKQGTPREASTSFPGGRSASHPFAGWARYAQHHYLRHSEETPPGGLLTSRLPALHLLHHRPVVYILLRPVPPLCAHLMQRWTWDTNDRKLAPLRSKAARILG